MGGPSSAWDVGVAYLTGLGTQYPQPTHIHTHPTSLLTVQQIHKHKVRAGGLFVLFESFWRERCCASTDVGEAHFLLY